MSFSLNDARRTMRQGWPHVREWQTRIQAQTIGIWSSKPMDHRHRINVIISMKLDKKDLLILESLQRDARQSLAAIGKRIGLSQPAMSERVRKLEDAGVIEGYGAHINLRAIGIGLQAIIRIQTTHAGIRKYVKLFEEMPEVLEADRVTGEDCFIVRCAIAEPLDLERVVDALAMHGGVTTSLVLSSPVRKTATVLAAGRSSG
jgi:Lrp/AsnC family leucine-responsive transcriptional regulator